MELLDFDADTLYFDEPMSAEAAHCLEQAAEEYGEPSAEERLLRAYSLQPEHPSVLVALYRFYYYQHRLEEALQIAERTLVQFAQRVGLPTDWHTITADGVAHYQGGVTPDLRFYLMALKGAGYLEMRLGRHRAAQQRFATVMLFDSDDRLGAGVLQQFAKAAENLPPP
ncbi:hypothetical protein D5085_16090 [Ectothiorhodospiraceae bacterium BW-2]|nr:hypothetical protein D5085_16090 [Ectothiorhodospiraceae bacterium BW-2]